MTDPTPILCFVTDCFRIATHRINNPLDRGYDLPMLEVCRGHWMRSRKLYWYRGRLSDRSNEPLMADTILK